MSRTNASTVFVLLLWNAVVVQGVPPDARTPLAFGSLTRPSNAHPSLRIAIHKKAACSWTRVQSTQLPQQQDDDDEEEEPTTTIRSRTRTRRAWLQHALSVGSVVTSSFVSSGAAGAEVFVDPDRYGDKELKIATVNKVRQNVRDAILQKPTLAPLLLKLAVADALTYNAASGDFGPDGSILEAVLGDKSSSNPSLTALRPAAQTLSDILVKLRRSTELTRADVVTLAGAEAIETVGGPRIPVQMGKLDPKTKQTQRTFVDLDRPSQVANAFRQAGLTEREMTLLFGMIQVAEKAALAAQPQEEEEEEEENEMGDKPVFIPQSFGSAKQIYGKTLGGATSINAVSIFQSKDFLRGGGDLVASWANKYGGNNAGFVKDIPEAYDKVMGLGRRYTGGKVGSLLGGNDQTL